MIRTTLCYIENGGAYLMLHRTKKHNDTNHDKWIGIGGKFEDGETPEQCIAREVFEETGLRPASFTQRGIVLFSSEIWPDEEMYLFTASSVTRETTACTEGVLEWVPIEKIPELPIWEGDRIFLSMLAENRPFFKLKLEYDSEDNLKNSQLL